VIGGFDVEVKQEEDELELLLLPSHSGWSRGVTAVYIAKTIDARYELCLSLVALLFFLADELSEWDPSLLAAQCCNAQVHSQPTDECRYRRYFRSDNADDVVSRMRNMNVSSSRTVLSPIYSLADRLLVKSGDTMGSQVLHIVSWMLRDFCSPYRLHMLRNKRLCFAKTFAYLGFMRLLVSS